MQARIVAGVVAGLGAGLFFGLMMQMMEAPTPEGARVPMMAMVAKVVRSESVAIGWVYHLFNSAVIGALFGWIFGSRIRRLAHGLGWGALYGVVWWVLGGLVLMPLLLGMPAFAPLLMPPMRTVALGSLLGHVIYGLVLGGAFVAFTQRAARRVERHV
jgi:hypothetical protein